jgi:hypothetical protein
MRNGRADRILGEALTREVSSGLRARSTPSDDAPGPVVLRRDRLERVLHDLVRHARLAQVMADERITGATLAEHLRAALGEACIVDEARTSEGFQCPRARPLVESALGQIPVQLRAGSIAIGKSPRGRRERRLRRCRLVVDQLSTPTASSMSTSIAASLAGWLGRSRAEIT